LSVPGFVNGSSGMLPRDRSELCNGVLMGSAASPLIGPSRTMTSGLPIDKWHDVIGAPTYADAILDRSSTTHTASISSATACTEHGPSRPERLTKPAFRCHNVTSEAPTLGVNIPEPWATQRNPQQVPMAPLLAADGATFSGLVEKIESQARASYLVTLDLGSDRKVENGSKAFASEMEATAWIEREADIRGFKSYSLSLKYPPNGTCSPLTPDMIGLRHRWRL
jgi:hypothetical protein